ncbi:hypothetical protein BDQ17DRAFT_1332717 [Cyathus striatus]|nr:hypothetical protein BDQ17DRAFT_1332717 [Cyathus striatus]
MFQSHSLLDDNGEKDVLAVGYLAEEYTITSATQFIIWAHLACRHRTCPLRTILSRFWTSSSSRCFMLADASEDHHTKICIYCEAARGNWIIARTQTYTYLTFACAQYEMEVAWPASGSAFALGNMNPASAYPQQPTALFRVGSRCPLSSIHEEGIPALDLGKIRWLDRCTSCSHVDATPSMAGPNPRLSLLLSTFGLDNLTGQLLQEESDCTAIF